ncbi:DUF3574 domain-containing protein [Siccirubricoccus phaeus]|uniref:DUF3574 domain-containing protein n=1 Tax=Siccirubricoccus phaeus TaxID=2595053 RepID=UPI00165B3942|nr:DUF3574 domain-containing protein [Siccirubricoccus phaeus]
MIRGAALPALALATACAAPPPPGETACPASFARRAVITGYFGRTSGGALRVTDAEWTRYLEAELLPRFPAGSTTTDATGTWRGALRPDPTKVVTLVVPPETETRSLAALQAAAEAYKRDFAQQSVGITLTQACAAGF